MSQLLRKTNTVSTTVTVTLDTNSVTGRKIRGARVVNVDGAGYAAIKKGAAAPATALDDDCWILPKVAGAEVVIPFTEAQTAQLSIKSSAATVIMVEVWPGANE